VSQRRPLEARVAAAAEAAYARQKQPEHVTQRQPAASDLVVIQPLKDFTCAECGDEWGDLLMSGVGREEARDRIRPAIDRVLAAWSQGD
jgi:hypothetical protein